MGRRAFCDLCKRQGNDGEFSSEYSAGPIESDAGPILLNIDAGEKEICEYCWDKEIIPAIERYAQAKQARADRGV